MAIPGILKTLARNNPMMGQIKQMMGMLQMAQNPQAMLNQMMMNNPQLKQVMDVINQYEGNVDKALEAKAAEYGITPQEIYEMLK